VFRDLRPQVVFHAAAHKHLPLLELHPAEGVKTNVMGTLNLAEAAVESGTETFILISTDKAADPTSVLGATKRLAERIVQSRVDGPTTFASVRFGNVLGSRGSFLSTLLEQIQGGAPITITHPDVTRFFMTIEEAVGLVLEAAGMAERGETYILDMGEPVRIVDLVRNTAAQLHLDESDLTIEYTGLRPGEKLNESLFGKDEEKVPTAHPRVWATRPTVPQEGFEVALSDLYEAAAANHSGRVWEMLRRVLPEYQPAGQTVDVPTLQEALVSVYPDGF
jgi:FlaA1/EpsC-like NDP-sugar epimerase